jgi:hypothetical protein
MYRVVFWDILPCKILSTDVSEVRTASIIRDESLRRQLWTSYSPPWELEISQYGCNYKAVSFIFCMLLCDVMLIKSGRSWWVGHIPEWRETKSHACVVWIVSWWETYIIKDLSFIKSVVHFFERIYIYIYIYIYMYIDTHIINVTSDISVVYVTLLNCNEHFQCKSTTV